VGGSDPDLMAHAAELAATFDYDEININVGCPSDRVQSGSFGACLMNRPDTVAECVKAMQDAGPVPVTVKTRIGVDDLDSYEFVRDFVAALVDAGCETVIVHARIAILSGLSPKDNRIVPPLNYDRVYRLKRAFPDLTLILNGGITAIEQVTEHLAHVDGVMIGRQAYQHPWFLTELAQTFGVSSDSVPAGRAEAVAMMLPYVERELGSGALLNHITRHMLGLFAGQPGARAWRRYLSQHSYLSGAGPEVLEQALAQLPLAA
jgi:tRNA-dihydrouridine synthase A